MKPDFQFSREKCVILFGICLISFMSHGITRSFSLLFVATLRKFGESRLMTSIPYTLVSSVRNFAGPLVGYVGNKFGLRFMIGFGGILSMLCICASSFADNIVYLIIFIGIGYGIGYGFSSMLLPQMLTYHFKTHTDKVIGLFYSFAILGALVLSAITEHLLNKYELSGTFLILSSITLHITLGALMLKKEKNNFIFNKNSKLPKSKDLLRKNETLQENQYMCLDETFQIGSINEIKEKETFLVSNAASDSQLEKKYKTAAFSMGDCEKNCNVIVYEHIKPREVSKKEITVNCEKYTTSGLFLVFLDPTYIVMNITQGLQLFVSLAFAVVLVDILLDKQLNNNESLQAFQCYLIGDIIGRLFCGFVTDGGCVSKIHYSTFSYLMLGISMCLLVWVRQYLIIVVLVSVIAFLCGGLITLGVGIIAMFTETENVQMGMASMHLSFAPLNLTAPFIIGYFRDILKSYDGLLYTFAAVCITCALMSAVTPAMARRRDNKKEIITSEKMLKPSLTS